MLGKELEWSSNFNQLVRKCFSILPTGPFLLLALPFSSQMTLDESLCHSGPPVLHSVHAAPLPLYCGKCGF